MPSNDVFLRVLESKEPSRTTTVKSFDLKKMRVDHMLPISSTKIVLLGAEYDYRAERHLREVNLYTFNTQTKELIKQFTFKPLNTPFIVGQLFSQYIAISESAQETYIFDLKTFDIVYIMTIDRPLIIFKRHIITAISDGLLEFWE